MDSPKRTPLFDLHRKLGARMTEFGGFEMPLSYSGIIEEHLAVRATAGLFDLSHMGEFEVSGSGSLALLQRAFTNSATRMRDGQAQYTLMCNESGGTLDDLLVYRHNSERYMLCVNASNTADDRQWLGGLADSVAAIRDQSDETALMALQGPLAQRILAELTALQLTELRRFRFAVGKVAGVDCMVARTGYTGEDGFELFMCAEAAPTVFTALLDAGRPHGIKACGLGARDTLRMEAGLPLYGHELDRETSPLMAGLGGFVKYDHNFVGKAALAAQLEAGLPRSLCGLRTDDGRSVARQGYKVFDDDREIGRVTSGTFAPSFGRPLAMAYLETNDGTPIAEGRRVVVDIRARMVPVTVVKLPFYHAASRRGQTVKEPG